jgi:hypothetical protein
VIVEALIGRHGLRLNDMSPSPVPVFSFCGVFSQNVDSADALPLMTQGVFDHVPVKTLLCQQCRTGTPQIVNSES